MVHVNHATKRVSRLHEEKFHQYLGMVVGYKIHTLYPNWKVVPKALKNLIWDDIVVCLLKHISFSNWLYLS